MAFSEIELKRIDKIVGGLCRQKTPQRYAKELKFEYRINGHDVLMVEIRPRWDNSQEMTEMSVAKLKFNRTRNAWTLFWQRASGKWLVYQPAAQKSTLEALVKEIADDSYGCFFG